MIPVQKITYKNIIDMRERLGARSGIRDGELTTDGPLACLARPTASVRSIPEQFVEVKNLARSSALDRPDNRFLGWLRFFDVLSAVVIVCSLLYFLHAILEFNGIFRFR